MTLQYFSLRPTVFVCTGKCAQVKKTWKGYRKRGKPSSVMQRNLWVFRDKFLTLVSPSRRCTRPHKHSAHTWFRCEDPLIERLIMNTHSGLFWWRWRPMGQPRSLLKYIKRSFWKSVEVVMGRSRAGCFADSKNYCWHSSTLTFFFFLICNHTVKWQSGWSSSSSQNFPFYCCC